MSEVIRYQSFDGLDIPINSVQTARRQCRKPGSRSRARARWSGWADAHRLSGDGAAPRQTMAMPSSAPTIAAPPVMARPSTTWMTSVMAKRICRTSCTGDRYLESLDWIDSDRDWGHWRFVWWLHGRGSAWHSNRTYFDVGINIFGVTNWVRTLAEHSAVVGGAKGSAV